MLKTWWERLATWACFVEKWLIVGELANYMPRRGGIDRAAVREKVDEFVRGER